MEENLLSTRAAYTELSHGKRIPKKPVLCKATKIWGLILTRWTEKIFFSKQNEGMGRCSAGEVFAVQVSVLTPERTLKAGRAGVGLQTQCWRGRCLELSGCFQAETKVDRS